MVINSAVARPVARPIYFGVYGYDGDDSEYLTPGVATAQTVGVATTSRTFTPDIVDGAALTFSTGTTCRKNETGLWLGVARTHDTGDSYELRIDSGAWEAEVAAVMSVDGVPTYTFTVTTIAEALYSLNPDGSNMLNPDGSPVLLPGAL